MWEDELDPVLYLERIKQERAQVLRRIYEDGDIISYILSVHRSMIDKYPEMIVDIITDNLDMEPGE